MDDQSRLPPMPPSDTGSLNRNHYDGFYKRTSRDFWRDNEINYIKDNPVDPCEHDFISKGTNAECIKCHFGLTMTVGLMVKEGKLFYRDESIEFKR